MLDQTSLLQGDERPALLHGLEGLGGDGQGDLFAQFGDKHGLFLEVDLAAALAGGVKLGGTHAVGISATDAGSFACYCAYSCHKNVFFPQLEVSVHFQPKCADDIMYYRICKSLTLYSSSLFLYSQQSSTR